MLDAYKVCLFLSFHLNHSIGEFAFSLVRPCVTVVRVLLTRQDSTPAFACRVWYALHLVLLAWIQALSCLPPSNQSDSVASLGTLLPGSSFSSRSSDDRCLSTRHARFQSELST